MKVMKEYLTVEDFYSDEFYIDSFNLERIFRANTFLSYRLKKIAVEKIIMAYPGAYIKLNESPVYKYLGGRSTNRGLQKLL